MDQEDGNFDCLKFKDGLSAYLASFSMACESFKVGWYNKTRRQVAGGTQLINAPDEALGFIVLSGPGFFNYLAKQYPESKSSSPVDDTTDAIMKGAVSRCGATLAAEALNVDKEPYIHAQSIGHLAGMVQYIDHNSTAVFSEEEESDLREDMRSTRDPKMWGDALDTFFPVAIHPRLGGWYVFRFILVLNRITSVEMPQPQPLAFLDDELKKAILREFNLHGELGRWRDLPGQKREDKYSALEYVFFNEPKMDKRKRILELASLE